MIYFQSQIDRIVKAKDDQLVDLKAQIVRLNQEIDLERRRANAAIDNILFMSGSTKITPTPVREPSAFVDLLGKVSEMNARIGILPDEDEPEVKSAIS